LCLFTCLAVRAIHIEVIPDITAEQFLLCLRRFISTHGKPKQIISDNASQFKVVKATVDHGWELSRTSPDTQSYLANKGIKWSFTIELAPWIGGFYKRLIGLVKQSLRKSIGKISLTMIQLETVIKEVEAVVNSRPLVYVGADFSSAFTLTPGDFLSLNPNRGVSSLAEEDRLQDPDFLSKLSSSQNVLDMWCKSQKHLNTFGSRAATVCTALGKLVNGTLNLLSPLECTEQRETPVQPSRSEDDQYDASHQRTGQKLPTECPIWKAAIKARQALKKLLNILSNC